ncbi:unnamed protein product [Parnassius mnemosyne]|uniref:Regulatory protein zeste n=1 Tax=Parnassius mnemosyne TaxID=213953 RepID=A0AAV1M4W6_9NEOP
MSKKNRGPNFCANEKEILIGLILKHKHIIENKKTDAVTIAHKNEGWKVLTEEFNSLSSFNVRNTDQLRTCWDNLKRTTRKDKAATKKEIFLTGGGKPNHPPPGPFQEQVEILLGPTLDGLHNEFDSDGQFQEDSVTPSNKVMEVAEVLPTLVLLDAVPGCSTVIDQAGSSGLNSSLAESEGLNKEAIDGRSRWEVQDKDNIWHGWSPAALKTKMSDALITKKKGSPTWLHRRRPRASMADNLLASKLELVEILKKNVEIEAEKKNLLLDEQLKQERLKTELLELQLSLAKNKN